MTTSIQALVDAQSEYISFLTESYSKVETLANIHGFIWDAETLDKGRRLREAIAQALADYHKSHLEPEVQSTDEATVATLRSSSPNSIEQ